MDKLEKIFELRESFMTSLKESKPHTTPTWPVDLSDKLSQQHLRDTALKGVEEMFEALQHLKNWKPHRETEIKEINPNHDIDVVIPIPDSSTTAAHQLAVDLKVPLSLIHISEPTRPY